MTADEITSPTAGVVVAQGCLRVFFGIFLLVGCAVIYFVGIRPFWLMSMARSWREVPCQILSSEVVAGQAKGGPVYSLEIDYRYDFDGKPYTSDKFTFAKVSTRGRAGKDLIVAQYPVGSHSICFVNPANPSQAVLHRSVGNLYWWGLMGVPFVLIGLLAFAPLRFYGRRSSASGPIRNRHSHSPTGAPTPAPGSPASGPAQLASRSTPLRRLLLLLFICLFWNGIVGTFLYVLFQEHQQSRPSWVIELFLSPFVLIGLGAFVGVLYQFLALANPRLQLIAQSPAIPLGGELSFSWSFEGHAERIRKLMFWLEGSEAATYQRGTTSSTDRHVFISLPIVETEFAEQIPAGVARVAIPAGLMHSFNGGNNQILWTLQARGHIPHFPDVKEEYTVTVLPLPVK